MAAPVIEFHDGPRRHYTIDGFKVPSVTQVLGVLDKPALPWWGMLIGIRGIIELGRMHKLTNDEESIVKSLTKHKLTVNHIRDQSAERGKGVHKALEDWCADGTAPRPSSALPENRGYIQGLTRWLIEAKPEPIAQEVMVGSKLHGFAGRYDLRATIAGQVCLCDLKTSKGVWDAALLQLAAYNLAAVEMGEDPADKLLVVRVSIDGEYEVVESHATAEMFLGVLGAYKALQDLKASRPRKARKRALEEHYAALPEDAQMTMPAAP